MIEVTSLKWLVLPISLQPLWLMLPVLIWAAVVGAVVGSFLNVVIHRLPEPDLSIVRPRSRCPKCRTEIIWQDNIPVFSYLWLKGRCRHCKVEISLRYPLVETAVGGMLAYLVWHFGFSLHTAEIFCLFCVLFCVALIDFDTWLIPNVLSLGLVPVGLFFAFLHPEKDVIVMDFFGLPEPFFNRLMGCVAGLFFLGALLVVSTYLLRKTGRLSENEFAMGWGDPFLLCGIGAFLGWQSLPLVIFLASAQGAAVGFWLIKKEKLNVVEPNEEDGWVPPPTGVPFGPFLALAAMESVLFFDQGGLGLFRLFIEQGAL